MKRLLMFALFCVAAAQAQVPTLIQAVNCPWSGDANVNGSSTPDYKCALPEPSQAGSLIVLTFFRDTANSSTMTVSDNKSQTYTQAVTRTSTNGNLTRVYYTNNVASGTQFFNVHGTHNNCCVAVMVAEFYNISTAVPPTDGTAICNSTDSTTTVTSGSITPTQAGDLLYMPVLNEDSTVVASLTSGSQPNIAWKWATSNPIDATGQQYGVYNSTSAINATATEGTSHNVSACVVAFKAATHGTAPTQTFRINSLHHVNIATSSANPSVLQIPVTGNLVVVSSVLGGNVGSAITGITSSPSYTWTSTGTAASNDSVSQVYYAAGVSPTNALTISITRDFHAGDDGTFLVYDVAGADTSPFDADSGGQTGNQTTLVSSLTTCSACLSPSSTSRELVIAHFNQQFCQAAGLTSPTGAVFDAATYNGNSLDAYQLADQDGGWGHVYTTSTSALTWTWTENCLSTPERLWAGRVAAFKTASAGGVRKRVVVTQH
jgi:hypothetical protein